MDHTWRWCYNGETMVYSILPRLVLYFPSQSYNEIPLRTLLILYDVARRSRMARGGVPKYLLFCGSILGVLVLAHSTGKSQDFMITPVSPYTVPHLQDTRGLHSGISATEPRPNASKWARARATRETRRCCSTGQRNQLWLYPNPTIGCRRGTCCQGSLGC